MNRAFFILDCSYFVQTTAKGCCGQDHKISQIAIFEGIFNEVT